MKCVDAKRGQRQKTENYKRNKHFYIEDQIKTKYNCCYSFQKKSLLKLEIFFLLE